VCYFLGSLFADWASGCYVRCGCIGSKVKWSRYRPGVAQRVGRGIALLFRDRGTIRWWVVSSTPRPHFTPGKDPVHIVQGFDPGSSSPLSVAIPTELPGPFVLVLLLVFTLQRFMSVFMVVISGFPPQYHETIICPSTNVYYCTNICTNK